MKKGLKIAAITVGVIIILMLLLPFAFQGKIADIVKTEGNKMLNAQFDFKKLNISLFRNFPQASVTLEDFWLKGTGEFANDTLVQLPPSTYSLFSEIAVTIFPKYSSKTQSCMPLCCRTDVPTGTLWSRIRQPLPRLPLQKKNLPLSK